MELDRGYLIAFEGIDGVGKSTQCQKLGDYLKSRGMPHQLLYEPTHGKWGKQIRKILVAGRGGISPEEELALFIRDRREDVEKNIRPALAQNKVVLLDRYYYSTAAYQGALGLDPESICRENETFAPRPDRVFLFLLPPEESLRRIRDCRKQDANTFEQLEYLKKVQALFETFNGSHFRRIDTRPSEEAVQDRLRREVDELLGLPH